MPPEKMPGELTTVFAHLSGMLLAEHDAAAAVQQLAHAAHQVIPAAAGAGVSLFDADGTRATTEATDAAVEAADALQYDLGQGPCLEIARIGDEVTVAGPVGCPSGGSSRLRLTADARG